MTASERERPSRYGRLAGDALAALAEAGRRVTTVAPDACLTCAFRPGTMTNQMASTALDALRCAIGADDAVFACHHGMKEGEPTRACAGWLAAKEAPWLDVRALMERLTTDLASALDGDDDPIRSAFDAWIASVDPEGHLNDHERARLYARAFPS